MSLLYWDMAVLSLHEVLINFDITCRIGGSIDQECKRVFTSCQQVTTLYTVYNKRTAIACGQVYIHEKIMQVWDGIALEQQNVSAQFPLLGVLLYRKQKPNWRTIMKTSMSRISIYWIELYTVTIEKYVSHLIWCTTLQCFYKMWYETKATSVCN